MIPTSRLPLALVAAFVTASGAAAQATDSTARRDTSAAHRLDPVVVTAERTSAPLAASAAAVTRLSAAELRQLPVSTVAGALELVPGMVVLHSDALGEAPRLAIRGFYGGGETEYVTVLLDGVPLTGLATGRVNWDLVPLASLDAIEIVRGGASAAYGDAAVGGVVNLITRRARGEGSWSRWRLEGGELGTVRAGAAAGGDLAGRAASLFGDLRQSGGYRDRESHHSGTLGGSFELLHDERGSLAISALEHRRRFDEPGPLNEAELSASRTGASPFARFDETDERVHRLTIDGATRVGARSRVTGYLGGERATSDAVRTVPLSADFADTQARELGISRLLGSVQLETSGILAGIANRFVLGADMSAGRLRNAYRPVVTGDSSAFASASGDQGDVTARGRGRRESVAAFASWEATPVEVLRLTLGGRVDRIADRFTPLAPSTGEGFHSTHVAVSPRAGANLRYVDGPRQTGHLYLTAGRSFKAPTIDQLFDQRAIPIPFPPFQVTTSNPELDPQYGTSLEAGVYHRTVLVPERVQARLALSVYEMQMRDELDFDLQQFRYVNIGRSRHRGLEAGLTLEAPRAARAFASWTRQDATSRFGENQGKQLKAVPRDAWALGIGRAPLHGLGLAATATTVRGTWLDDANTRPLAPYTRLDARASWAVRHLRLTVDVRNLLDREYSTTGFPDPAGSGTLLLYPAAGRVVTVGVESFR
ncbi:MAG TPA: TonB-dependent receptor [Gemmatimonadaceae bacterium]|nr:TonB-dependent receptor [Gemmatimonadaceae bacterium]